MDSVLYGALCLVAMLIYNPIRDRFICKTYADWSVSQVVGVIVALILIAIPETMLLSAIEQGEWGGSLFFGAVLLVPVTFPPVAKLLRLGYGEMLDYIAPHACIILMVMKLRCFVAGCCRGIALPFSWDAYTHYFPSREVEIVAVFCIFLTLLIIEAKKGLRGRGFGLFMILYGSAMFVLTFFLRFKPPFLFGITGKHIWSVLTILGGAGSLLYIRYRDRKQAEQEEA